MSKKGQQETVSTEISSASLKKQTSPTTEASYPPLTTAHRAHYINSTSYSNACVSSWIAYFNSIVTHEVKTWYDKRRDVWVEPCTDITTFTVKTTSTLTKTTTTECDGTPRAVSTGETVITTVTSARLPGTCLKQATAKEEYDIFSQDPTDNRPNCHISNLDCADAWETLLAAFTYYIAYDGDRIFKSYNRSEVRRFCEGKVSPCFDLDRHVALDSVSVMLDWRDHLFVNCPYGLLFLRKLRIHGGSDFLKTLNNRTDVSPPNVLNSKLDELYGCDVTVDSFVLLYFPPDIPQKRDICADSGYGEFFSHQLATSLTDPAVHAVVTTIVFDQHDLRYSRAVISKNPFPFFFGKNVYQL
jgi:hypothetical protein